MAVFVAVWTIACMRTCKPEERLIVYHRGKYNRVSGPGICCVIFPEEDAIVIRLDEYVPTWRKLAPIVILREFDRLAQDNRLPPAPHP